MRRFQIGSLIVLAVAAMIAYSLTMPANAQAPPKALELEPGKNITVVYSLTAASNDTMNDADFVSLNADWLVVTHKGKRSFVPVKNILRMDVRK